MRISIEVQCQECLKVFKIKADPIDIQAWREGELIQNAMPYLGADDRELLVSQICGPCFDEMFREEA